MDPWKVSTAALGTLSAVLGVALAVVWAMPPEPRLVEVPVVVEQPATAPTTRTEVVLPDPGSADVELRPLRVAPSDASGASSSPAWVTDPEAPLPDDVMERARAQLRTERLGRRMDARDRVRDELDAFLDEEDVDAATAERVHEVLDAHIARMDALRDQLRSGELDRLDARKQFRDSRIELRDTIDETLGAELAEKLRARMAGPGGEPRGPGVGGRGL